MNYNIKSNSGITMVVLIITIILLIILTSVTATVSKDSLIQSKKYGFLSELEIIQKKVSVINKEIQLGSTAYNDIGTKYDDLDTNKKEKVKEILKQNGITDCYKYIYMSKEDLLKIGLKNIEQNVIMSNENSIVYSYDGIRLKGNTYFSIEELNKI